MKLLSAQYTTGAINIALLLLRAGAGILMLPHGYNKLTHFAEYKSNFMSFLGLGNTITLGLVVFAEFFCALFVITGLFTRVAVIPLIINMSVAVIQAHGGQIFGEGEHAGLFFLIFLTLLFSGPGRYSIDGLRGK